MNDALTYIKNNPFKTIGNLSLLVGGILFLIYFFHINYMPILDIPNSIHLLFAMAITGFYIMLSLVGLLVMPGILWESYRKDFLKDSDEKKQNKIFTTVLFLTQIATTFILSIQKMKDYWYIWVIVFLLLFITYLFIQNIDKKIELSFALFITILFSLFSWIAILPIYIGGDIEYFSGIVLGIIIIVIINSLIVHGKNYIQGVALGFIVLITLMLLSKNYNLIQNVFMKKLHLGGYTIHQVNMKKRSCEILKTYNKPLASEDNTSCVINNIDVQLKLGKETLIKMTSSSEANISLIIPSEDIVSYSWKDEIIKKLKK